MENKQVIYLHIFIALLAGFLLFISFKPLIDVAESVLMMDAVVSGFILSGLLLLLKNTVKYSHFSLLEFRQRFANYSALAILFVVCWIGLEYFILYISLSEGEWNLFMPVLGVRILLAILTYVLAVLVYNNIYTVKEIDLIDEEEPVDNSELVEVAEKTETIERIAVRNGQKIDVVMISEVIYLQAEGDYVMIHSTKGKFLKEQTMKSFENLLPADKFVRVHRSSIVNVDFITQIELYGKQTQLLKMRNGTEVKISLNGYKLLKQVLGL